MIHCWLRLQLHRWLAKSDHQHRVRGRCRTIITYECERCGRPRTRTLDGSWTIEDLT